MAQANSSITAAQRAELFHEQYGNGVDAGRTLADLVIATGDYLSSIVGAVDADAGMARIVEPVVNTAGYSINATSEWRSALQNARSNCYSEWPMGERLHNLAAYAIYGIVLHESADPEVLAKHISALVAEAEDFLAKSPVNQWAINAASSGTSDLVMLVRLATNRWALDNGRPIEPAALAMFGGVTEGRIRNIMSDSKSKLSNEGGKIPAHEALVWLAHRPEFWNSIWRNQHLPQYGLDNRAPLAVATFVPVARDGSIFHPGLERNGSFTIGEKGAETAFDTFDEALRELQRMPVPRWRRPNEKGHWGIVRGVRWERLDAQDLALFATNPGQKLPVQDS